MTKLKLSFYQQKLNKLVVFVFILKAIIHFNFFIIAIDIKILIKITLFGYYYSYFNIDISVEKEITFICKLVHSTNLQLANDKHNRNYILL